MEIPKQEIHTAILSLGLQIRTFSKCRIDNIPTKDRGINKARKERKDFFEELKRTHDRLLQWYNNLEE